MAKNGKDKTISIRLSQEMLEALDARATLGKKDRTQVIREAINKYLELSGESVEDKLQVLEQEQVFLNKVIGLMCASDTPSFRYEGGEAHQ